MSFGNHHAQVHEIKSQTPAECAKIIAGRTFQGQGHHIKNSLGAYAARACPNQRLVKAFGIENSFIVTEKQASEDFRGVVEQKIQANAPEWVDFAAVARSIALEQVSGEEESRNLFEVVQMLSIKMVRKVIWGVGEEAEGIDDQLCVLAREVNKQWLKSKKYDDAFLQAGDEVEMPEELKKALMEVFDWDGEDRKANPLNFILPGYETIWRVVLRCFIELSARYHSNSSVWVKAFKEFLDNPTPKQLKHRMGVNGDEISALMVSKEILRLYPPTRRVYRRFEDENGEAYSIAADIESMQRDASVWEGDPLTFRPERWIDISGEDEKWLPFGAKPFRCPAKQSLNVYIPFGVSMIAVLTGALLEATENRWEYSGEALPDVGIPLDTDREAYREAELRKIKSQA
ncbi:hypothetical protein CBER1_04343 [Cercospora berteroae]|uniref:Cytochrome P450 n=1 Tax=Cercospora berteroae TaxID=357750 RepID=A0A2S6CJ98_9PEZI|nr:hypothetical protein CBER1_04343 [Cercospora berteroae]